MKIIHQIRTKLNEANAIVTKADEGNSIVIIHEAEYNNKIHSFISNKEFDTSKQDITKKQQQKFRTSINWSTDLIPINEGMEIHQPQSL